MYLPKFKPFENNTKRRMLKVEKCQWNAKQINITKKGAKENKKNKPT